MLEPPTASYDDPEFNGYVNIYETELRPPFLLIYRCSRRDEMSSPLRCFFAPRGLRFPRCPPDVRPLRPWFRVSSRRLGHWLPTGSFLLTL